MSREFSRILKKINMKENSLTTQTTINLVVEAIVKITTAQQSSHKPLAPNEVQKFIRDLSGTLVECVNEVNSAIGPELVGTAIQQSASTSRAMTGGANIGGQSKSIHELYPDLPREPAVPIDQSITEKKLICLFDGKPFTMLARYLRTRYKMEPEQYREYWNLGDDYPMVSPSFKASKSKTAKDQGFGKDSRGRPRKDKVKASFSGRQSSKIQASKTKTRGRPKGTGKKTNIKGKKANIFGVGKPEI